MECDEKFVLERKEEKYVMKIQFQTLIIIIFIRQGDNVNMSTSS